MGNSDKELRIHISTTADSSGLATIGADFDKVREKLHGTYQETRDFRQLFQELDREAPGFGSALLGMVSGPFGQMAALTTATVLFTQELNKMEQAADKAREATAKLYTEIFINGVDSLKQAATIGQKYEDFLDRLKEKTDDLHASQELQNAILDEIADVSGKRQSAQDKNKAQMDQDQQNVIAATANLNDNKTTADEATKAAQDFASNKPGAVSHAEGEKGDLAKNASDALAAFLKVTNATTIQEAMANLTTASNEYQSRFAASGGTDPMLPIMKQTVDFMQSSLDTWNRSKEAITSNQNAIDSWNNKLTALTSTAITAQAALTKANADLNSANQAFAGASAKYNIGSAAGRGITPDLISSAIGAYSSVMDSSGGFPETMGGSGASTIVALRQALELNHQNVENILTLIMQMVEQHKSQAQIIASVSAQVRSVATNGTQ